MMDHQAMRSERSKRVPARLAPIIRCYSPLRDSRQYPRAFQRHATGGDQRTLFVAP